MRHRYTFSAALAATSHPHLVFTLAGASLASLGGSRSTADMQVQSLARKARLADAIAGSSHAIRHRGEKVDARLHELVSVADESAGFSWLPPPIA